MSTQTANLKLSLYEPDDAANLCDGYNDSMNKIDTYAHSNDANITTIDATLSSHTDKINTNATNISQEVTRAKLAEDTLRGTVNTLSTNVTNSSTNITTNTNNIASLTTKTNQNTTDIATNTNNIASTSSAITKEISDRTTADAALQSKINNLAPKSAVIYKYNIADLPSLNSKIQTGAGTSVGYVEYDSTYNILYINVNFYFGTSGISGTAVPMFTLPTIIPRPTSEINIPATRITTTGAVNTCGLRISTAGLVDVGNLSMSNPVTDVVGCVAMPWGPFSTAA